MLEKFAIGFLSAAGVILIGTLLAAMICGIVDKIYECKLKKISIRNDRVRDEIRLINERMYYDPKMCAICKRINEIIIGKQNQNIDEFIDLLSKINGNWSKEKI